MDQRHRHDILLDAVLVDLELVLLQVGYEHATIVPDNDVLGDGVNLHAKRRRGLRSAVALGRTTSWLAAALSWRARSRILRGEAGGHGEPKRSRPEPPNLHLHTRMIMPRPVFFDAFAVRMGSTVRAPV